MQRVQRLPRSPNLLWPPCLGQKRQGGLWKGLQGEGAPGGLGRAEPRREGGETALRAGQPFGIWSRCARVPRLKEFSKSPSIWAPSLLQARRGAQQMVCTQNSFGSGGEGDLSKGGWSSAPALPAWLWQQRFPTRRRCVVVGRQDLRLLEVFVSLQTTPGGL